MQFWGEIVEIKIVYNISCGEQLKIRNVIDIRFCERNPVSDELYVSAKDGNNKTSWLTYLLGDGNVNVLLVNLPATVLRKASLGREKKA